MKMTSIAWAGLLTCSILAGGTQGQDLKQPLSVRPIGFNYNNFTEGAAPPASAGQVISQIVDPVNSAVPTPSAGSVISSQPITSQSIVSPAPSTQTIGTGTIMQAPVGTPAPVAAPQIYSQAPPAPMAAAPSCGCPPAAAAPSCGCAPVAAPCGCGPAPCGGGGCGLGGGGCGLLGGGGCSLGLCDCCLGDAWTLSGALHGDCPPAITIGGWFQAGYYSENNDLFFDRTDELALHQGWLFAEKAATADSPLGFRADFMYGQDADDTQAFGNNPGEWDFLNGFDRGAGYGWAIPQLYAEVALGENVTVKAGHFYTLIGYEVVTAPDNFFFSHAMTMFNSEPFTHTGVLATINVSDNLTAYAGWTLGWDTGFDQLGDGSSWLGGFSYTLSDNAAFTYMSTAGDFGWRGSNAYSHSLVLDMSLTDSLNYVVQSDLVRVDSTGEDNVGLNQYLLYSVSDCLGLGARMEWWKGDVLTGYAPHGGVLPAAGSLSYYAATFGANVRPHANVIVRPEVRIDWSPAADYDEAYFAVDAIFTF